MKKCGNCYWFLNEISISNEAPCVRNPPQIIEDSLFQFDNGYIAARAYYPVVTKDTPACGEWEIKSIFEYKVLP
jgi:hypothetical protein